MKCSSEHKLVLGKHRQAMLVDKKEIEDKVCIIQLPQVMHYLAHTFLVYHNECCEFHYNLLLMVMVVFKGVEESRLQFNISKKWYVYIQFNAQ